MEFPRGYLAWRVSGAVGACGAGAPRAAGCAGAVFFQRLFLHALRAFVSLADLPACIVGPG